MLSLRRPAARPGDGRRALARDVAGAAGGDPVPGRALADRTSAATTTGSTVRSARTRPPSPAPCTPSAAGRTATPNAIFRMLEGLSVPAQGADRAVGAPVARGGLSGAGDRLPAGSAALVGSLAEGDRHRDHGRAACCDSGCSTRRRRRAATTSGRDGGRPSTSWPSPRIEPRSLDVNAAGLGRRSRPAPRTQPLEPAHGRRSTPARGCPTATRPTCPATSATRTPRRSPSTASRSTSRSSCSDNPVARLTLSCDRPAAVLAVRLCEVSARWGVAADQRAASSTSCHRESHEHPRRSSRARPYQVAVPLKAIAHSAGGRQPAAAGDLDQLLAVDLAVAASRRRSPCTPAPPARCELPVRPPRPEDAALARVRRGRRSPSRWPSSGCASGCPTCGSSTTTSRGVRRVPDVARAVGRQAVPRRARLRRPRPHPVRDRRGRPAVGRRRTASAPSRSAAATGSTRIEMLSEMTSDADALHRVRDARRLRGRRPLLRPAPQRPGAA